MDLRQAISKTSIKKLKNCKSFHFRYLELCRSKNISALREVRSKGNVNTVLEFCGDKLGVTDWLLVNDALSNDVFLHSIDIRMHKAGGDVLEEIDSERKARLFKQRPVIYTKFIMTSFLGAISNTIENNKNLKVLHLEGLPLYGKYLEKVVKALTCNDTITDISFARSSIKDEGCGVICGAVKYLENIEKLNLSECDLTAAGAEYIADMIKIQKISRYTEGWELSLRYREVNPDAISGLRVIIIARNPNIGDNGLRSIIEVLTDDVWIKMLDFENCGLTDISANTILDCLDVNIYIHDINVRNNPGISKFHQRAVREALGKDDEELAKPAHNKRGVKAGNGVKGKNQTPPNLGELKVMLEQMKLLQEELVMECILRKKAENLNLKLGDRVRTIENDLEKKTNEQMPEGYSIVKCEVLQSIMQELEQYKKIIESLKTADAPAARKLVNIYGKPRPSVIVESNSNKTDKNMNHRNQTTKTQPVVNHVRKVKSEMKYVDSPVQSKSHTSKSDHDCDNETNYNMTAEKIEKNVGDAASMVHVSNSPRSRNQYVEKPINVLPRNKFHFDANDHGDGLDNIMEYNATRIKKHEVECEIEKLSLSSKHSFYGGCEDAHSSESETLRDSRETTPFKVFISRNRKPSTHPISKTGEKMKSPRALFLGCNS